MKRSGIVILTLFLAVFANSAIVSNECKSKNQFLKELSRQNVNLYELPTSLDASDTTCKSYWSDAKTCCKSESLIKYADQDEKNQMNALDEVNKEIEVYFDFLSSLRKNLHFLANLKLDTWDTSNQQLFNLRNNAGNELRHASIVSSDLLKRQIFIDFPDKSSIEKFKNTTQKCWSHMVKLRKAILCPICSGNSQRYFIDKMVIIQESTCVDIVSRCAESFKGLIFYLRAISKLQVFLNIEMWTNGLIEVYGNQLEYNSDRATKIFKEQFEEHMDTIMRSDNLEKELDGKNTDMIFSRTICRLVLKIRGYTLLEETAKLFKGLGLKARLFEPLEEAKKFLNVQENGDALVADKGMKIGPSEMKIISILDDKESQKVENAIKSGMPTALSTDITKTDLHDFNQEQRSTGRKSINKRWRDIFQGYNWSDSRKLQNFGTSVSDEVFSADVVVLRKSDNMFSSFDGNKGTSLDISYSNAQPLNIESMNFP